MVQWPPLITELCTMNSRLNLSHSPGQQWVCLLLCFILFKGCSPNDMVVTSAPIHTLPNETVSLYCAPRHNTTVFQVQWSHCNDSNYILVFSPTLGLHINDHRYEGRVSMNKYHTFTLKHLQEDDFGEYCCHLTTYPSGSLKGRLLLLKDDGKGPSMDTPEDEHEGLSLMMMVYIACGIVVIVLLNGIIIVVVCKKRRRKLRNPKYIISQAAGGPTSQPQEQGKGQGASPDVNTQQTDGRQEGCDGDDEDYLNISKPSPANP
ncbi:nectin-4-like [Brachyhypopomus gauderio]|uniref:nectin-4-like n=1 Tax=Brachyhypopomus gauderio TaxID=698409 RepID=UPI0040420B93